MSATAIDVTHLSEDLQHGSKYSNQDRAQAVYAYVATGTLKRTSVATGIPVPTLQDWRRKTWWAELITRVHEEKKDEYNSGFSRIIEKSMQVIEKQLEDGEVKARDAATILGITFDKKQILNLKPTTITAKSIDISKLQSQFEDYLKAKTIDADVVHTTETD